MQLYDCKNKTHLAIADYEEYMFILKDDSKLKVKLNLLSYINIFTSSVDYI